MKTKLVVRCLLLLLLCISIFACLSCETWAESIYLA